MMVEAYIDFAIMTILSINAFNRYPELKFYGTFWDAFSSVGTILTCIILVCYPIYGTVGIYRNLENLDDEETLS